MFTNLGNGFPWKEADEMLNLLVERAVELVSSRPGSFQEKEFNTIAAVVENYAAKRCPRHFRRSRPWQRGKRSPDEL